MTLQHCLKYKTCDVTARTRMLARPEINSPSSSLTPVSAALLHQLSPPLALCGSGRARH
jgi:hypothetical protein